MKTATPLIAYREHLTNVVQLVPYMTERKLKLLGRITAAIGKPLVEAATGSEVVAAIQAVALGRKLAYNGGRADQGQTFRARLGQEAKLFMEWAHAEGLTQRNVYPRNVFRKPPMADAPRLEGSQVPAVLKAIERISLRDRLLVRFILDTGVRVSEAAGIKASDIDLSARTVRVFATKVQRWKTPPFSPECARLIRAYLNDPARPASEYLFPNRSGGQITAKALRLRFAILSKRLGFRVAPHMVRHTAGTIWMRGGAQQVEVMQFLGHVDLKTTNHYLHLTGQDLRKTQARVTRKFRFYGSPRTAKRN